MDAIQWLPLSQSGVILLVVMMVLTDRLVWHKRLEEKQRQIDAMTSQLEEQGKQVSMLLRESVPTVNAVLNALHAAAAEERHETAP